MGSTRTPRLFALTARSYWILVTYPLLGAPFAKPASTASTLAASTRASGPSIASKRRSTARRCSGRSAFPKAGRRRKPSERSMPEGVVLGHPFRGLLGQLLGHVLQHVVLVGDEVHRAGQHLRQRTVPFLGHRHDLVAHIGAEAVGVGVGGILAPERAGLVADHGLPR